MTGERLEPRTLLLTAAAMLAFAGNSLLCRLALASTSIDPASFTAIRLLAGAITLLAIVRVRRVPLALRQRSNPLSVGALFVYAAAFSYAYVTLNAATGALLLFGFVQVTMIVAALLRGERPGLHEWIGWLAAAGGLVTLLLPGASAPPLAGAILMASAGIAWGLYSLRGSTSGNALAATASNFLLSLLLLPLLLLVDLHPTLSLHGVGLAIVSGAITSGLGYVLWYAALPGLRSMQAALVQLSVPVITAVGAVLLLDETPGWRLALAALLILGGIAYSLRARHRPVL